MNPKIKKIIAREGVIFVTILLLATILMSGCGNYDNGYDDGYDGAKKEFVLFGAGEYNNGYEDGANDAYYFDLGYRDAQDEEPARYPSMTEYMEGYREGS